MTPSTSKRTTRTVKRSFNEPQKNTDTKVSENDVISKFNSDYENKKYQSTEDKKRTVDINHLLNDLDGPMFN
ncbi:hypothetical protein GL981_11830 (plasmid) [Spiroplasma citri]|nr:hypothetical protein GL981_11830 [Spiroplasma citri]